MELIVKFYVVVGHVGLLRCADHMMEEGLPGTANAANRVEFAYKRQDSPFSEGLHRGHTLKLPECLRDNAHLLHDRINVYAQEVGDCGEGSELGRVDTEA